MTKVWSSRITGPGYRFIGQGPDAVIYNKLLTATDVIEPGRQAEPVPGVLIDPYREINSRYLPLIEREHIFDLHKVGDGVHAIARVLGGPRPQFAGNYAVITPLRVRMSRGLPNAR